MQKPCAQDRLDVTVFYLTQLYQRLSHDRDHWTRTGRQLADAIDTFNQQLQQWAHLDKAVQQQLTATIDEKDLIRSRRRWQQRFKRQHTRCWQSALKILKEILGQFYRKPEVYYEIIKTTWHVLNNGGSWLPFSVRSWESWWVAGCSIIYAFNFIMMAVIIFQPWMLSRFDQQEMF